MFHSPNTINFHPIIHAIWRNWSTKAWNMKINIDRRRTQYNIDPEWDRSWLQENLQRIGSSLVSIHPSSGRPIFDIDSTRYQASCLIQLESNRSDGNYNSKEFGNSFVAVKYFIWYDKETKP
jgi:hypothetical protein